MAILTLTPQTVIAKYPSLPLTANSADFVWTAAGADFADKARFVHTGREAILVRNDNGGAQTVTIESSADPKGRTGNITTYSVGAGEYAVFPPFPVTGWRQITGGNTGYLVLSASAADVYFAILRLPE
jgi:hypothetical protein